MSLVDLLNSSPDVLGPCVLIVIGAGLMMLCHLDGQKWPRI